MTMSYFAYGSNLNADDLRRWCDERRPPRGLNLTKICNATLPDYELRFGRRSKRRDGGVLDVWPARGFEVPGVLFELSENDLKMLDHKEGYPTAYERRSVNVRTSDGDVVSAVTYVGARSGSQAFVKPNGAYLGIVRLGWQDHGLPLDVLEAVAGTHEDATGSLPRSLPVCSSVFVYGTLLRGESRARLVHDLGPSSWLLGDARGLIVDCGDYPALVGGSEPRLPGELIVFDDERIDTVLDALDEVEGYKGFGRRDNLFERRLVNVNMGDDHWREGWAYFLADRTTALPAVPANDWRAARGRRAGFFADLARKHLDGLDVAAVMTHVMSRWRLAEARLPIRDGVDLALVLAEGVLSERQLAQATGRWVVV